MVTPLSKVYIAVTAYQIWTGKPDHVFVMDALGPVAVKFHQPASTR